MLANRGFGIGRWFGFEVRIDYSWFVIFALVLWTFSATVFPAELPGYSTVAYAAMGLAGTLLFFLSVLLHELSHSAMARSRGIEVEGITLFIFGGVAQTSMEAEEAIDEFLLTVVGPLSSIALAGLFWALSIGADFFALGEPTIAVATYLAWLNGILAAFNMLPGFPLDGGRIFRSTVWHFTGNLEKATRWASRGGRVVGYLLIGLGLFELFMGELVGGLWSAFIGWFLSNAADASWRQFRARKTLSRIPVSRVMVRDPLTLPAGMPVERAVEVCFQRRPHSAYPVTEEGRLVGMVSLDHVKDVPRERWGETTVHDLMRPIENVPTVDPRQSLDEVVSGLKMDEHSRILVVQDGVLLGVVTLGDIGAWVSRARELGLDREEEAVELAAADSASGALAGDGPGRSRGSIVAGGRPDEDTRTEGTGG